jgi:hypothetical protein
MNPVHSAESSGDPLEMDERTPVTRADLEGWGRRFKREFEADLIQRIYRAAFMLSVGFILSVIGVAVALSVWRLGMERRIELAEARVADIDEHGSNAVQSMRWQLDSLRTYIRYDLAGAIIMQLEQRDAWRKR